MCWALNHQNIIKMAQGHISLSRGTKGFGLGDCHVLSTKSGGRSDPRAQTVRGPAIRSTQVIILISCVVIHLITWELLAIS
jgi:hypothetical protein